ncbi:MAG: hypothetical protein MMC23_003407 [Stictis urceolatum]|nr:hypothetical protein [Stictis urceolata]
MGLVPHGAIGATSSPYKHQKEENPSYVVPSDGKTTNLDQPHGSTPVSPSTSLHQAGSPGPGPFPATHIPPDDTSGAPEVAYPEGGLRANLVVLGAFCAMLSCFGLMNTIGTLQTYLSTHQLASYSPSAIGWIFSIYIFMAFFGGVQIGPIFDAKGPRWLIAAGTVAIVGGVVATAEATEYWHFVLSFSILSGLGTSLLFTPSISAIAHWFAVKRGTATGIATTAGSIGGVIFPLALPELFEKIGFAWTMRLLALMFLVLCIAANFLIRARLPPKHGSSVWPDFTIFRDPNFAATTAGVFFIEWGLFVPLTYLASWALRTGVGGEQFGYHLIAVFNAASFFGRWLPGYAADRWGRFNTMIVVTLQALVSLLCFWLPGSLDSPARGSVALAVLFSAGFGFASGSGISLTPVCVGQLCSTEEYGRYYSTCYSIVSFGCLTGVSKKSFAQPRMPNLFSSQ